LTKEIPLDYFLARELNNGYKQPLGAAIVDITKGPPTNRKRKKLYNSARLLANSIEQIEFEGELPGIERILMGMRSPDNTFSSRGVSTFCGAEKVLSSIIKQKIRKESHLKKYVNVILAKELSVLGGGGIWNGEFYFNGEKISDYTILITNYSRIFNLMKNIEKYGFVKL